MFKENGYVFYVGKSDVVKGEAHSGWHVGEEVGRVVEKSNSIWESQNMKKLGIISGVMWFK